MKKTLVILPLVLAMTACSLKYEAGMEFKAPEFGGGDQQDEVAYPDWYTDTPKKDDQALYAVASEYSKDFQFSPFLSFQEHDKILHETPYFHKQ